jgi:hypothetical protein
MTLRAHLLVQNNEDTIERSIKSLLPLDCEIVIGNMGSRDKSIDICRDYSIKIFQVGNRKDYSIMRNQLLGEDWNLFIHPWEVLASGHESIIGVTSGTAYYLQVYQKQSINYEIRLWRNLKFQNPVFETIVCDDASCLDGVVVYALKLVKNDDQIELLESWKKQGTMEPYYYESYILFGNKKYKEFLETAKYYLSVESFSKSSIMLRYYMAQTYLYVYNNIEEAIKTLSPCIIARPLMAEFWCLLGDAYYKLKRYNKAKNLYENAYLLGSRRLNNDQWPLEISKYNEYPTKMIRSCEDCETGIQFSTPNLTH